MERSCSFPGSFAQLDQIISKTFWESSKWSWDLWRYCNFVVDLWTIFFFTVHGPTEPTIPHVSDLTTQGLQYYLDLAGESALLSVLALGPYTGFRVCLSGLHNNALGLRETPSRLGLHNNALDFAWTPSRLGLHNNARGFAWDSVTTWFA
jgi:hypothetical protein